MNIQVDTLEIVKFFEWFSYFDRKEPGYEYLVGYYSSRQQKVWDGIVIFTGRNLNMNIQLDTTRDCKIFGMVQLF